MFGHGYYGVGMFGGGYFGPAGTRTPTPPIPEGTDHTMSIQTTQRRISRLRQG